MDLIMENKWIKLKLNTNKEIDTQTWLNLEEKLLLQNHFIRGWEILPNSNDVEIINSFYGKYKNGLRGNSKQACIEIYNNYKK